MTTISNYHPVQHTFARPPSPPMEPIKCTLPSISNLIGLADAGSPTHESAPAYSPRSEAPSSRRHSLLKSGSRPGSAYGKGYSRGFPPSPPMSTDASLDNRSPSTKSVSQFSNPSTPTAYYHHETTPPLESDRHVAAQSSYPRQIPSMAPSTGETAGYFPPTAGMAYQRPLPSVQSFPPPMAVHVTAPGPISWQHHHYLQPVPGHLFTQSQDRYICQTCNKAFSRPSSLRIHSHSHTGEKPFKCSQVGCGKAFSVRSNMKRHERGCHATSIEVAAGRAVRIQ